MTSTILVDTHVHIYDCFNIQTLLESAWQNFQAQVPAESVHFIGVLLLTETAQYDWFSNTISQLQASPKPTASATDWTFSPTAESCSIWATGPQQKRLLLIAGRQIITAEKLEVLSLITEKTVPDGLSLEATIQRIQENDGLAVLPWGVGKWLGSRGKLVEQLVLANPLTPFFLGDNSGRPTFWPRPSYFDEIKAQGRPILPGTDPLPIASEATRPGSFGLAIPGHLNEDTPGSQLKKLFLDPDNTWQTYGSLETPLRFLRNQLSMRLSKKRKKSPP